MWLDGDCNLRHIVGDLLNIKLDRIAPLLCKRLIEIALLNVAWNMLYMNRLEYMYATVDLLLTSTIGATIVERCSGVARINVHNGIPGYGNGSYKV